MRKLNQISDACSMHQPVDTVWLMEELGRNLISPNSNIDIVSILLKGTMKEVRVDYEYFEGNLDDIIFEALSWRHGILTDFFDTLSDP